VLHLDSQSIRGASAEVEPWVPFLRRVREIVLTGATREKIVYYDPAEPNQSAIEAKVQSLVRQLAAKFRAVGATASYDDADKDCQSLSEKFGGIRGRILLVRETADEQEESANYIGMLAVTSSTHWRESTGEPVCQLRYLWVNPMYQGESIGRVLVQEGIAYAVKEMKASTVYVELSPALEHAITVFRDAGFRAARQSPESSDRLLFEFPVVRRQ
jgi:ribosomal protein S18 acetylase RimI-like enzyme